MTVKDLLQAGLAKVKKGWCQDSAYGANEKVCAWAGIRASVRDCPDFLTLPEEDDLIEGAIKTFEQANRITNIIKWNDTPGRTQDEVIQAYEKAISSLDTADEVS